MGGDGSCRRPTSLSDVPAKKNSLLYDLGKREMEPDLKSQLSQALGVSHH